MKQPKRNIPDVGASAGPRSVRVADVMTSAVVTVDPNRPVGEVRSLMAERGFHCTPVVDEDGAPVGIVSTSDLLKRTPDGSPVSDVMTPDVYTVPMYSGVNVAARMMRNHHIHHLVVTHEGKVAGILSTFDLLQLVEDKRFTAKGTASTSKKGGKRKNREGS